MQRSHFVKKNAREHGVVAHEGTRVLDLLWDGDRAAGVTIRREDGTTRDVRAKLVVDASGQAGLIQNRLRLRVWEMSSPEFAAKVKKGPAVMFTSCRAACRW